MENFDLGIEVAILVLQRVEAVGTGSDNFFDSVPFEGRDILHCLFLEEELFSKAAGRVASASFFVAKAGETDSSRFE